MAANRPLAPRPWFESIFARSTLTAPADRGQKPGLPAGSSKRSVAAPVARSPSLSREGARLGVLPAGRAPRGRSPTRCMSPNGATSERAAGRFAFGALPSGAASAWRTRVKWSGRGLQRSFPRWAAGARCAPRLLGAFRTLPLARRDLGAAGSVDVRGGRGAEPAAGTRCRSPPASGPSEPSYRVYRRPLPRPCGSRTAAPAAATRSARPSPRCFRGRSFQAPGEPLHGPGSGAKPSRDPPGDQPICRSTISRCVRRLTSVPSGALHTVMGTPPRSRDPRSLDALHRRGADLTAQPLASGSSGWSL